MSGQDSPASRLAALALGNARAGHPSRRAGCEKGEVLLRGVGTPRYLFPPNASVQCQPDGLTIHTNMRFLGAGFLGAPPISLTGCDAGPGG